MPAHKDRSSGYDSVADEFARLRRTSGIGLETILHWAKRLPVGATVLDIGCGSGDPVAKELSRLGYSLAGIDASQRLMEEFHRQIPQAPWACEAVEDSSFFGRKFDAILAIGLLFLLSEESQHIVIGKVGDALDVDGSFLFTAPRQACEWVDVLTGRRSISLGSREYEAALMRAGLVVTENYVDEGENYYFACRKSG
jgi:2-polyprenyl-3-methyl-5-hydroxy-6-metoxy-1,4-benzoquinol methylase